MFTFCNDTVNNNLDTVNDTVFEKNIEKFLCRAPPYQVLNFNRTRLELKAQETLIFPVFFITPKSPNCCQFSKI